MAQHETAAARQNLEGTHLPSSSPEADTVRHRVARVVAWLEDLAGQDFDRRQAASDAEGGSLMYFGETQGLPVQTCHALGSKGLSAGGAQMVTELDPDAFTRSVNWPVHYDTSLCLVTMYYVALGANSS